MSSLSAQITISGTVQREDDTPIGNVPVVLSGSVEEVVYTDNDGNYAFSVPSGSYSISVLSNADHQNGVTTLDLVLIERHRLGLALLDSPYKLLAADVDQSGVIDDIDLNQISEIIYAALQAFPNNNSWRFYDATYQFPDPSNPWLEAVPELVSINGATEDQEVNFIGVKIGDVNLSSNPIVADYDCDFGCGQLRGQVAHDSSEDCLIDDDERPLGG